MQRGLTHGAENGARSVLAGNVERIDGNAEKRQAKFAFRAFCKDVTAGRRRQEGGLVRENGSPVGRRRRVVTSRLCCTDAALLKLPGARARRCGRPPGREGEVTGARPADGCGRRMPGGRRQALCSDCGRPVWGAKFRAECDKDESWENNFPKRQGLRALLFLLHAILHAEKFAGQSWGRREAKAHGSGGEGQGKGGLQGLPA